jgi:hypothetical protein
MSFYHFLRYTAVAMLGIAGFILVCYLVEMV